MSNAVKEKDAVNYGRVWADRIKVCLITAVLAAIANTIYGWRGHAAVIYAPWEVAPALLYMFCIILVSCALHDLLEQVLPFQVPVILYIALITTILSFPFTGWFSETMATEFAKIQLLPLCTPILAYAGISVGKDLDTFKKQGLAIVVTALVTFVGTWIGSAVIAQVVMKLTGVI